MAPTAGSYNRLRFFFSVLLLLAGDVELNPGPSSTTASSTTLKFACLNIRSATSVTNELDKPSVLQQFLLEQSTDILTLTETWLSPDTPYSVLNSLKPPDFSILHTPRPHGIGGGVATIYRSSLKASKISFPVFTSFESMVTNFCTSSGSFLVATIYRPPSSSLATFMTEFSTFLSDLCTRSSNPLISGDFNLHIDDNNGPYVLPFLLLLESFGLKQHVSFPTHSSGHTLDLIVTFSDSNLVSSVDQTFPALSDHNALLADLSFPIHHRSTRISKTVRAISSINITQFKQDILSSVLYSNPSDNLSDYLDQFHSTVTSLMDKHAPPRVISHSSRPSKPFITPEIRAEKSKRSKLESAYRKSKTPENLLKFKTQAKLVAKLITTARRSFYRNLVTEFSSQPKKLWSTLNSILSRSTKAPLPSNSSSSELANSFLNFFGEKISRLISAIPISPFRPDIPTSPTFLSSFLPATGQEIKTAVLCSSNASCDSDILPTKLLKSCLDVLLPPITHLINLCLSESTFPSCFKSALITPLIKKGGLPADELSSYRPISHLSFLSKTFERFLLNRLLTHLHSHPSLTAFQSAYRKFHSVETALLRIQNDLLLAIDKKQISALVLLDLSAAFDTIDHNILLDRLSSTFGLRGSALDLLRSYLTDRTQKVLINDKSSPSSSLSTGVPQGSVLGPLLFTLYTAPLASVLNNSNISFHFYADDTQLYISFSADDSDAKLGYLSGVLDSLYQWFTSNKLSINPGKTEFLLIGSPQQRQKLLSPNVTFCSNIITPSASVRNLGIVFDSDLSFSQHISSVCRSAFFLVRRLRQIRSCLDRNSAILLANSLVSSKIDFCNSLFYNLPKSSISRLQLIQNSLARVIYPSTRRSDHISPVLRDLHWLPVKERIIFKIAVLTFKSLHGLAPPYLADLLTHYTPPRSLRSANKLLLLVPSINSAAGRRSFSFAAPTVWNSLPFHLRSCDSLSVFCSQLKTHLFPP